MSDLTTRSTKGSALTHNEMDANLKQSTQTKAANYTVVEGDNRDSIDVTATATITLPDAAAIVSASDTADFEVTIKCLSGTTTIARLTGTDTIDGTAANITLQVNESNTFKVNQAGNGYNTKSYSHGGTITADLVGDVTGNVTGDVTGNATTATAWETGQTLTLSGDLTGNTGAFDGSTAISLNALIANNIIENENFRPPAAGDAVVVKRLIGGSTPVETSATSYDAIDTYHHIPQTTIVIGNILVSGVIRVAAKHKTNNAGDIQYTRILKNGVQQVEWTTTSISYVDKTVDITVTIGDIIIMQHRIEDVSSTSSVRSLFVKSTNANLAIA